MVLVPVACTLIHLAFGVADTVTQSITATAGNMLICGGMTQSSPNSQFSRGSDIWTRDVKDGLVAQYYVDIASSTNVTGGAVDLVISDVGNGNVSRTYFCMELTNVPAGNVRDNSNPATQSGSLSGTTATSSTVTNISNDSIFVALVTSASSVNPATFTLDTSGGWSSVFAGTDMTYTNRGSLSSAVAMAYKLVQSASTSDQASWTIDSSAWKTLIVCYHGFGADQPGRGMG